MHFLIKTANRADINGNFILADMADKMIKVYAQEDIVYDIYRDLGKFMQDFRIQASDEFGLKAATYLMGLHNNHIVNLKQEQELSSRYQEQQTQQPQRSQPIKEDDFQGRGFDF